MSTIVFEFDQLFKQQFGTKPHIVKVPPNNYEGEPDIVPSKALEMFGGRTLINNPVLYSQSGAPLTANDLFGVEVWLPIYFFNLPTGIGDNGRLFLPYSVIKISGGSPNWIRTPLSERQGTAKELYNNDDYKISIKGFFIDKERRLLPEKDLLALKKLNELGTSFSIWNAITDILLSSPTEGNYDQQQVVFTGFELPEVEGGRKSMRPFSMSLESDNIFTLEVE